MASQKRTLPPITYKHTYLITHNTNLTPSDIRSRSAAASAAHALSRIVCHTNAPPPNHSHSTNKRTHSGTAHNTQHTQTPTHIRRFSVQVQPLAVPKVCPSSSQCCCSQSVGKPCRGYRGRPRASQRHSAIKHNGSDDFERFHLHRAEACG